MLNSCLGLFSAACSRRRPFSRSYGAILPSSLAMLPPPALGSSPHPPVSVYGTGAYGAIAAFLGRRLLHFATFVSLHVTPLAFRMRLSPHAAYCACTGLSTPGLHLPPASPQVLPICGTGISACSPSATHPCLALGPDSPREDKLYPGTLGYSAGRIPTSLSLLIPAFSLPAPPPPLPVRLLCCRDAPLPAYAFAYAPRLRRRV